VASVCTEAMLLAEAVAGGQLRQCDPAVLAHAVQVTYNGSLLTWAIYRQGQVAEQVRHDLAAVGAVPLPRRWRDPGAMTPRAADWQALRGAIAGAVVLPGAPDYESVRKPAMARFQNVRPAAVVLCQASADVSETIGFARRFRVHTAIRGGGHSVAGRSTTEGIVVDVTPMGSVSVAGDVATVGAGVRLGALYDALAEHGRTIPAGCGPSVGIAGLTLGGGLGILGRKHGLTCDHLLRAQVVLADGRVVECDEHTARELFWALRGAGGGNFGVVTSFVFRTLPAPAATVFHLAWPPAHAAAVVGAWQAWAPTGPDELDATLRVTAAGEGGRPPRVDLVGTVLGGEADATQLLDDLVARVGADPASTARRSLPYGRPSATSTSSDRSTTSASEPPGTSRHRKATCSPSRSSSGDRCLVRPALRWWSTSHGDRLGATHAR
jgi:hypothetical protein